VGQVAVEGAEFKGRKAPYAPVSAFSEFLDKIPDKSIPAHVDRAFLQRLNVAAGNEWALLSALKFLGVIDAQGAPTTAYRRLLDSEHRREALGRLVADAYRPLLDLGGASWSWEDLVNYFRVASSPSQARNAARFFRSALQLGSLPTEQRTETVATGDAGGAVAAHQPDGEMDVRASNRRDDTNSSALVLAEAKSRLLEKLPEPNPAWSAAEYAAIVDKFLEILKHLDT